MEKEILIDPTIQQLVDKKLLIEELSENIIDDMIFIGRKCSNNKNHIFISIRQLIADNKVRDFSILYRFLYDSIDKFDKDKIPSLILIIAEAQTNDSFIVDKEIGFMAAIVKILNELKG